MRTKFCYLLELFSFSFLATTALARSAENGVRVRIVVGDNCSKTLCQADTANRRMVATTSAAGGEARNQIAYELDAVGRYERAQVFDQKRRAPFQDALPSMISRGDYPGKRN